MSGEGKVFDCLLVARHESTVDTAFFSLLLKQTDDICVYERVGLMRHEDTVVGGNPTRITIV